MVVVGTADPVGLSRLARGLVELREAVGPRPVHVVVNRMRASLGLGRARRGRAWWRGSPASPGVHFLPDDRPAVDRALVAGRTLAEVGRLAAARGRWARSSTACSPRRGRRAGAGGSGGEQQVEPTDGEADHREQQRQLAGELVPPREQVHGAVVGRDHAEDVPGDHRQHLDVGQQRRVAGRASSSTDQSAVPNRLLPCRHRVADLDQRLLADLDQVASGSARRRSPTTIGTTECANRPRQLRAPGVARGRRWRSCPTTKTTPTSEAEAQQRRGW